MDIQSRREGWPTKTTFVHPQADRGKNRMSIVTECEESGLYHWSKAERDGRKTWPLIRYEATAKCLFHYQLEGREWGWAGNLGPK